MARRSKHPKAAESRQRYWAYKNAIIAIIGNVCVRCGVKTNNIQPHHKMPASWSRRKVWSLSRMKIYLQEAREGKLEALCGRCNREVGSPCMDDGNF